MVLLALVAAACQATPSPTPTASVPATSPTAATTADPTGSPSAEASPTLPPTLPPNEPVTSAGKIEAAVETGAIDEATGILYRVFAVFGDARLPSEYRGEPEEDLAALTVAREHLAELPGEIQAMLTPYLVRPTDPASAWNTEPATGAAGGIILAAAKPPVTVPAIVEAAPACDGLWMHEQVSPNIPVMIWAQCAGDPLAAAALFEEARGYMAALYGPETALMVAPLGDRNVENDGYTDTPETGDGLIDIYLLSGFTPSGIPRAFALGSAWGVAAGTPPFVGAAGAEASSSYVVMAPQTGAGLEATLAHEFFHVLQSSINRNGRVDCPVRRLSGCSDLSMKFHWFGEASATWAAHEFVPRARALKAYPWYDRFRGTGVGLADTVDSNAYASFAWPLFMEQEDGATSIGDAWRAMRGKRGWQAVQAALDGRFPFEKHFRDFGVRVMNRELLPGDPTRPRFRSPTLDPTFPDYLPTGLRHDPDPLDDLIDPMGGSSRTYRFRSQLDFMWTQYLPIEPPPGARKLTFDFTAFAPEIDVDAIVRIGDTGWERRKLIQGENVWCLEKPADDFREGFLVFSNHDQTPQVLVRDWAITAEEAGCGVPVGTLAYSFLDTAPLSSAPGGSSSINATVQVRLKANPDLGDPYNAMYLNDGSTYGVNTFDHILGPPDVTGCQPVFDSTGSPGGRLELDSVVGNTWVDELGKSHLTLGISLPVHVETSEGWCALGSANSSSERSVQFPDCDGDETAAAATERTRTFVFDCDFQGPTQSWSVSGILVIDR